MAGARRSRSEWKQLVDEVTSGESLEQVARRHGVRPQTLKWWRWQLRRGKVARSATKAVHMVPVRVREPSQPKADTDVVEVLVRGVIIRARVGQDPHYIADVAAALAARC